jgi:hypothetical protein
MDTSAVSLPAELLALSEILAKNTHEVWARQRLAEGWRYGEQRNEQNKEHPCLVPYEELPDSEKQYDRNTTMESLKLLVALGCKIECPGLAARAKN